MTSAFSWHNSISLCTDSFRIPRPILPITPGVSWLPTFAFQTPIVKKTSFLVLVVKGLVGLHWTIQLHLLQSYWLQHRFGLPWYWMARLGNEQRSFCHFWDYIQVLHFGLFCWPWWLLPKVRTLWHCNSISPSHSLRCFYFVFYFCMSYIYKRHFALCSELHFKEGEF